MSEHLTTMIVGKGAREHALSAAHERSPEVERVIVTPGNDYIAHGREKEVLSVPSALDNPLSIIEVADRFKPDLIEIAQEDALAGGVVDLLKGDGYRTFGPDRRAARIESDKRWSRGLMMRNEIPHPRFASFNDRTEANHYLAGRYEGHHENKVFVKAAGLCAGKGAIKAESLGEALAAVDRMSEFGEAGEWFLVEDAAAGEEFSYYAISDGTTFRTFKSAQDNKRALEGDRGEQTGGMGATAPALVTDGLESKVELEQIAPALEGMRKFDHPYEGILYLGATKLRDGRIINIEYNARWGDPEAQAIVPGIESDYVKLLLEATEGRLRDAELTESDLTRVCVVGAAKGYPGRYETGMEITGLGRALEVPGVEIFGAAIAAEDGKLFAEGGRLFSVVGSGTDTVHARERAYEAMKYVSVGDGQLHYRKDIGRRDVERLYDAAQ